MIKQEKWIRVSEYARLKGISPKSVYMQINANKVVHKKEYNLILIKVE